MTMIDKLDGAFAVMKARPSRVVAVTAAVMLPAHFLGAFLLRGSPSLVDQLGILGTASSSGSSNALSTGYNPFVTLVFATLAVGASSLGYMLLGGALTPLVLSWYTGGDITAGEALRAMGRRAPVLVGAYLVVAPLHMLSALCSLPGLFFTPVFLVMAPAIMAEGVGPVQAAKRSWELTLRRFGSVFTTVGLAWLVASLLGSVLGILVQIAGAATPSAWRWVATGFGQGLLSLVVAPFGVGVALLVYLDLRIRAEGLDIELGLRDAFAASAAPAS